MVMAQESRDRERAQLVLISAITIAFILLGVVVVFNGVLYTQTLSSSASGQTVSDAERTAAELTQGVLTIAEQREDVALDPGDSGPFLDDVDSFLDHYQNRTAANRPAIISSNTSTVNGTYATANLSAERNVSDVDIYGVALTLESGDLNGGNITVELNGSADVTISEDGDTLEIQRNGTNCAIETGGEPATIDFVTGTIHGAERTTCSASRLPPTTDADLVVTRSENMSDVQLEALFADGSTSSDWENDENAVIAVEIDIEYVTNDLTQSRTIEVPMPLGVSDS